VTPVALEIARSASPTLTVNEADTLDGVSSGSVAVQVTVVVPTRNVEPEAWSHTTGGSGVSSSTAVGGVKATTAPAAPVAAVVMSDGTPASPRSVSLTVTVNEVDAVDGVSSASVAVHVTVVVPMANAEPDGWSHTTATGPSSSPAVGLV